MASAPHLEPLLLTCQISLIHRLPLAAVVLCGVPFALCGVGESRRNFLNRSRHPCRKAMGGGHRKLAMGRRVSSFS